jgi:oligoribonuclease (3'-5' exoribonuclease)
MTLVHADTLEPALDPPLLHIIVPQDLPPNQTIESAREVLVRRCNSWSAVAHSKSGLLDKVASASVRAQRHGVRSVLPRLPESVDGATAPRPMRTLPVQPTHIDGCDDAPVAPLGPPLTEVQAEVATVAGEAFAAWHRRVRHAGPFLLAGSTLHADRLFIGRYLPTIAASIHHGSVDVATVRSLGHAWAPRTMRRAPRGSGSHRVRPDIAEGLQELKWLRKHLWQAEPADSTARGPARW